MSAVPRSPAAFRKVSGPGWTRRAYVVRGGGEQDGDDGWSDQEQPHAEQGGQPGEGGDRVAGQACPRRRAPRAEAHHPGWSGTGDGELPFDLDQHPPFALAEDHAGVHSCSIASATVPVRGCGQPRPRLLIRAVATEAFDPRLVTPGTLHHVHGPRVLAPSPQKIDTPGLEGVRMTQGGPSIVADDQPMTGTRSGLPGLQSWPCSTALLTVPPSQEGVAIHHWE